MTDGVAAFLALSKALKHAGDVTMRRELNAGLRRAAKPMVADAGVAAGESFPKRGGLAAREAQVPFKVAVRTGASTAGVSIVAPGRFVNAKSSNATGKIRHPVFGDKRSGLTKWVEQDVGNRGWFDAAMSRNAPKVRAEINEAVLRVMTQIIREAHRA